MRVPAMKRTMQIMVPGTCSTKTAVPVVVAAIGSMDGTPAHIISPEICFYIKQVVNSKFYV